MSDAVLPGLCFRPLPADLCSMSTAFAEPEIQWQCDRSLPKTVPTKRKLLELAHPSKGLADF